MGDKEDLLQMLTERFDHFDEKFDHRFDNLTDAFDRFKTRVISLFALIVTIILFTIGGSFAYTSRVAGELDDACEEVTNLGNDLTDIDGALGQKFPDSSVFGERAKRERAQRGMAN